MDQAQRATVFLYGSNPPFGGTHMLCVSSMLQGYIGVTRNHVIPEITGLVFKHCPTMWFLCCQDTKRLNRLAALFSPLPVYHVKYASRVNYVILSPHSATQPSSMGKWLWVTCRLPVPRWTFVINGTKGGKGMYLQMGTGPIRETKASECCAINRFPHKGPGSCCR